jgi:hypothetical protein
MKLKEKFLPFIDDIDLINDIPNKEWGLRNASKCVEIADEFAIGFADWFHANCYEDQVGYYTASELLETYKKEKDYEKIIISIRNVCCNRM